ncbi:ABC transporter ATP-binding protein [Granulosicoccus antarcticus]|uniref:Maltose/maltodextrin import ATP-binding protein MalK n=1 Tax=Granulosicoccus antarcticus IMCC3135 TaxID=1192854 RepID=A0A2Z2NHF5_9GAMM|nr:sn-glycerol-3-phosphate ABC transporter ATP-binding protein UgpC [Granulosicoccus antarcticus]ASJ70746.1 Maltose/maltodextrin import ATP-binding protein MalK [Granulosicoccus antarcticus IMCC3135]
MAGLLLKDVKKSYAGVDVLNGIDLDVQDGEFIVFVGPSGCGKSTLLRMIAGLEEISAGEIWIDDKLCNDIPAKLRGIAMVFQSYALYPHKTVFQNMSFGLQIARTPAEQIKTKVNEAAEILEITHLLDRKPGQLSGGQRQRVAIGRAIVRDPKVFLFDEPLSNLDAALRVHMRMEIAKLHADLDATMVYVTHDQTEAMTLADRIVVLESGLARQIGTPLELYHLPRDMFVAGFIGSPKMNFLKVVVKEILDDRVIVAAEDIGTLSVPVRPGSTLSIGNKVTLGVRPEHIGQCTNGSGIDAVIEVAENTGENALLKLRTSTDRTLMWSVSGEELWKVGQRCCIELGPRNLQLFDDEGMALVQVNRPKVLE